MSRLLIRVRPWLLASRPATLAAAVVPVAVGTACALGVGRWEPGAILGALVGAVFIQIGTNFANDLFDFEKGADAGERLGPTRAVQAGLLTVAEARAGMTVAFCAATLAGGYLTFIAGWPVVAIGVASIASGIAYTGGPYPLGYHGLGDLFVLIFFGFVAVCGTAFVEVGQVPPLAWAASVPVGALATAILVVNNIRDRELDAKAGKRTLVVRLGRRAAVAEYAALILSAQLAPVILVLSGRASGWLLATLLTAPLGGRLLWILARRDGRALNPILGATALLLLLHGSLLAVGLAVGGVR